jgi:hypothetical protein
MVRSRRLVLLSVVFAVVTVAACDKAGDKTAANGSGGQAAAPAAGSQAAAAGGQPATPAAGSQAVTAGGQPAAPAAGSQAVAAGGGQAAAPGPAAPSQPAAAGEPPASPPAESPLKVGAAVDGKWTNGRWYPGKIGAINADGTFRVNYNDGDVSKSLPASKVRLRRAGAPHSGGGGGGGGSCRSGLTQCGGRCVDIHDDNRNCNACGRTCPEACMGGSCVSNHYKYGN